MKPSPKTYSYIGVLMFAAIVLLPLFSCSSDEDANSDIAQLTAEMCIATTGEAKQIISATTDSDVKLAFTQSLTTSWAQKPDSVYRTLLYYNKVSDSNVKPIRADKVYVLLLKTPEQAKKWSSDADPLGLTSSWFAKNGKYLNLQLALKNGSTDDENQSQTLGLVCDSTIVSVNGKRKYCHLCHNQNNVPTYYTVDVYASIPTDELVKGDTLTVTMPLWSGSVQKDFIK